MTDRLALAFAHLVAGACCLGAGWFVHTQASPWMPMVDEWKLLADRLAAPDLAAWCFEHHNQHRYPLAKAVWVAAMELDGGRFRLGQFVTVGLLTAASVLLIWTARGMRGRAHVADAVLPILLLNLGHSYNLLMSYQLGFALVVYGVAGWLWTASRLARGGGMPWAVLAGLFGSVVVLSGGFGFLFTLPLAGWAVATAARTGRIDFRRAGHTLVGFALGWLAYGMWILQTMPATPPEVASVGQFATAVGDYFAIGLGPWLADGHLGPRLIGVILATAALLAAVVVTSRATWDSGRLAILAGLLGGGLVAAATAYARGYGLAGRFVTPSAVVLAIAWLALTTRTAGWLTGLVAVAVGGGLYWLNLDPGLREGYQTRCIAHEMQGDIAAGVPPVFLAGRYGGTIPVLSGDATAEHLKAFQRGRVSAFAGLAADPAFRTEPVAGVAVPLEFACPESEFLATPRAVRLPDPTKAVIGLRLQVRNVVPAGWQRVRLHWNDGSADRSAVAYPPWVPFDRVHLTFPLSGRPTEIRLVADSIVQTFTVDAVEWMIGE